MAEKPKTPMFNSEPSLIRRWAAEHRISPPGGVAADRLSITVDRVRIHLVALSAEELLVEARVTDLPPQESARTQFLERAMQLATGRMVSCPAALVIDAAGVSLKLQARVSTGVTTDILDQAVSMMASEVEMWRGLL